MVDADKADEEFPCHVHDAHRLLRADEMSMKRWSQRSERQYPSVGDGDEDAVVRHEV